MGEGSSHDLPQPDPWRMEAWAQLTPTGPRVLTHTLSYLPGSATQREGGACWAVLAAPSQARVCPCPGHVTSWNKVGLWAPRRGVPEGLTPTVHIPFHLSTVPTSSDPLHTWILGLAGPRGCRRGPGPAEPRLPGSPRATPPKTLPRRCPTPRGCPPYHRPSRQGSSSSRGRMLPGSEADTPRCPWFYCITRGSPMAPLDSFSRPFLDPGSTGPGFAGT